MDVVRAEQEAGRGFDVLLFGNEAADTGDYQVGIRVAHALGLPCVTGIKRLEVSDGIATARRESASGGWEIFEVGLPAVFTVKEGINLPRYPSVPGRMRAKKKEIERIAPTRLARPGSSGSRLKLPPEQERRGRDPGQRSRGGRGRGRRLAAARDGRPMILVWVDHDDGDAGRAVARGADVRVGVWPHPSDVAWRPS